MEAQPAATTIEVASGTIVEARGITRDFRSGSGVVHALRGIDLRVQPGELVAHRRAILDVDTRGLVDEHAHQSAMQCEFPVHQLVPERGHRLFEQLAQSAAPLR